MQVSDYTFEDGQLQLRCAEAVVGSVQLRFLDPATNSPKDKTRTKPHIITRHLATKPGQVRSAHTGQRTGAAVDTGRYQDTSLINLSGEWCGQQRRARVPRPVCRSFLTHGC